MPASPDMLMRRAARHHLAGELREAASLYRKLLQDDPQHAGALHALGVMAQQTGRADAAEKLLLRAVATDPSFAAAHDDLGALWLIQGKTEQAAAAFGEAIRVDPNYAKAHAHLGAALTALGKPEEAAVAYQQAVDVAMTAVRRFKGVGIDVSPVTESLRTALTPPRRAAAAEPAALPYPTAGGTDDEDDPQEPSESVMTLVDDEDEDGVVGLTLVPPSATTALTPLAARAEEIGFAYASMSGVAMTPSAYPWPAGSSEFPPADAEPVPTMTAIVPDPAAWQPWLAVGEDRPAVFLPAIPEPAAVPREQSDDPESGLVQRDNAADTAIGPPMVEAEVGDPRFDAPNAMMAGGFGGRGMATPAGALPPAPMPSRTQLPAGGSNGDGHVPGMASVEAAPAQPIDPVPSDPTPAAPPVETDDAVFDIARPMPGAFEPAVIDAPSLGLSGELPPAPITNLTVATPDAVLADAESTLSSEVIEVVPLAVTTAAPVEDEEKFVELAEEADPSVGLPPDTTDEDAEDETAVEPAEEPEGSLPPDIIDVTVMPPAPRRVKLKLPASAARLADDPVLAPRQLAKELRRARRKPVAGAKQAAELHKQGTTHLRQRRVEEAIAALERLVELQPTSAKAHRDLGAAYIRGDRFDDAIASLQKALELRPRFADAYASLGDAYHLQGRVDDAINSYRQTLTLRPSAATAHSNLLLNLNYQRKNDAQMLFGEHLKWAKTHAAPLSREILPHENSPIPDRQIRIGYVSGDFRRHAVGSFIEPVLANREPESFHVICYSDVLRPDDTTERLAEMCDGWRDIRGLTDAEVAEMIREDRIDILVDLAGHTGNNRLGTFARKPAPVQVTYLGYPNTTGLQTMDYRLTDVWADPLGQSEKFHTEQLYRLPRGFLCYQGPADAPAAVPPPVAKNGFVTFGCFNILAKLTPETLGLWAKIMTVLPNSRIVLKDRLGTLANPARRRFVQDIFAYHRISGDRLDLLGKEPDRRKHLESYSKVDIMLDPFPYNGTTTTCEALWMGVPVITLTGDRHASRVGVSILKSAGMPEFIATNIEGYARSAVLLARDVNRLTLLRRTLRQKVAASSLCDAPRFTKILGMAYREMWTYWCQTRGTAMLPGGAQGGQAFLPVSQHPDDA